MFGKSSRVKSRKAHVNSLAPLTSISGGWRKHQHLDLHDFSEFDPGGQLDVIDESAILLQLDPTLLLRKWYWPESARSEDRDHIGDLSTTALVHAELPKRIDLLREIKPSLPFRLYPRITGSMLDFVGLNKTTSSGCRRCVVYAVRRTRMILSRTA